MLVSFALETKDIRQTVLKERLKAADDRVHCARLAGRQARKEEMKLPYRISVINTEISICVNTFRNLFAIGKKKWRNLKEDCFERYHAPGPMVHGNTGNTNRSASLSRSGVRESVVAFLTDISKEHGESYATRFIREISGMSLRKEEEGLVEIPSFFTKRKLYAEYCFSRGYKIKSNAKGSYGLISQYELRDFDDLLWPEGSVPLPVCSWKDFLHIWKTELPTLKIRNQCEDTCGECTRIKNSLVELDRKTAKAKKANQLDALESLDADSEGSAEDTLEDVLENFDEVLAQEYPFEAVILIATQHATHAQNQRKLATERIAESKATANENWEDRRFVFVFFCFFRFPVWFAKPNIADC